MLTVDLREVCTCQVFSETFWYNALPIGVFYDDRYGKLEIDKKLVETLANNFWKGYTSYNPPIKIGHGDDAESPGHIRSAEARVDGLYVLLEVNDEIAGKIRSGLFRFMSLEYHPDYTDKYSGEKVGPVIMGIALTNQPGHPGVVPIELSDGAWRQQKQEKAPSVIKFERADVMKNKQVEGGQNTMGQVVSTGKEVALSDDALAQMKVQLSEVAENNKKLSDSLAEQIKLNEEATRQIAELNRAKRLTDITKFCDGYLSRGIPPVTVNVVKELLLSDDGVDLVKLSDGTSTNLLGAFTKILDSVPVVSLRNSGDPTIVSESDSSKVVALAEALAASANKTNTKKRG